MSLVQCPLGGLLYAFVGQAPSMLQVYYGYNDSELETDSPLKPETNEYLTTLLSPSVC